jgi:hypothetical protein
VKPVNVRLEGRGDEEEALRLEGTADAGESGGKLLFDEGMELGIGGVLGDRAFQDMDEREAEFLEFSLDRFRGLPCCGDLSGSENGGGFAVEREIRRVEKVVVAFGSKCA